MYGFHLLHQSKLQWAVLVLYLKQDIVIQDAKNKVTVTLWNDNAKLPVELGKVIMIEQTMPKVYAGEIC